MSGRRRKTKPKQANQQPQPHPDANQSQQGEQPRGNESRDHQSWQKWTTWATIAIAAANVATVGAFIWVSIAQQGLTRESNEHAYRAWLTVKDLSKDAERPDAVIAGSGKAMEIIVENTGRSPAQSVHVSGGIAVKPRNWAVPDQRPPPVTGRSISVIGANQTEAIPLGHRPLSAKEIHELKSGAAILFLFGWLKYADQFSSSRETRFCLYYDPTDTRQPAAVQNCRHHNSVQ